MLVVSTFNIQNDYKNYQMDKTFDIIHYIKKYKIDILGLQEVYYLLEKDLMEHLLSLHYTMMGKYRFLNFFFFRTFNEKTPVVTRKKVISTKTYQLPFFPAPLKRVVTKVVVEYKGKLISIYNTHLDCFFEKVKLRELKKLYQLISHDDNLIILMGDFNLKNNKKIFNDFEALLKEKGIFRVALGEKTWKNSRYKREIDHIFLSKEFQLKSWEVVKDLEISDHYPVVVQVEI